MSLLLPTFYVYYQPKTKHNQPVRPHIMQYDICMTRPKMNIQGYLNQCPSWWCFGPLHRQVDFWRISQTATILRFQFLRTKYSHVACVLFICHNDNGYVISAPVYHSFFQYEVDQCGWCMRKWIAVQLDHSGSGIGLLAVSLHTIDPMMAHCHLNHQIRNKQRYFSHIRNVTFEKMFRIYLLRSQLFCSVFNVLFSPLTVEHHYMEM